MMFGKTQVNVEPYQLASFVLVCKLGLRRRTLGLLTASQFVLDISFCLIEDMKYFVHEMRILLEAKGIETCIGQ